LYNLEGQEDAFHFIAVCPLLGEIRMSFFGVRELPAEEAFLYVNGKDWQRLLSYVRCAWKYRKSILEVV